MKTILSKLYDRQISSKGLGVFRILFCLNFFFEIFRIYRYRHLYYDTVPYVEISLLSKQFIWCVWLSVLFLLIIGLKTRLASVFNYIFLIAFIQNNPAYEYHMDYTYAIVFFFFMLIPVNDSYSVDNLLLRLRYSNKVKLFIPKEKTSKSYYLLLFLFGVAIVYFDSAVLKSKSIAWTNGLGLWLPASIPQITIMNNQWFLNQEILVKFLGYFTLLFEFMLLFLFWFKKMRLPMFAIGVFFHIGIILQFPIPFFGLGVIAVYFLLIPVRYWEKMERTFYRKTKLTFFYDEECPLCLRTKIIINFFDIFKQIEFKGVQTFGFNDKRLSNFTQEELLDNIYSIDKKGLVRSGVDTYFKVFQYLPIFYVLLLFKLPGFYQISKCIYNLIAINRNVERCTFDNCAMPYNPVIEDKNKIKLFKNLYVHDLKKMGFGFLLVLFVAFQFNSTFQLKGAKKLAKEYVILKKPVVSYFKMSNKLRSFSQFFFGITKHSVFLDNHYKGFDTIYTLSYKGKLLPLYTEEGRPDFYQKGGVWANYNFRVNGPHTEFETKKLQKGLIRYSSFFIGDNALKLEGSTFKILKKNIIANFNWEKDLLKRNLDIPWEEVGELKWENSTPLITKY